MSFSKYTNLEKDVEIILTKKDLHDIFCTDTCDDFCKIPKTLYTCKSHLDEIQKLSLYDFNRTITKCRYCSLAACNCYVQKFTTVYDGSSTTSKLCMNCLLENCLGSDLILKKLQEMEQTIKEQALELEKK